MNREVHKEIRRVIRSSNTRLITKTIEENKNMRVLKAKMASGRQILTKVRDSRDVIDCKHNRILQYTSKVEAEKNPRIAITNIGSEEMLEITVTEISAA